MEKRIRISKRDYAGLLCEIFVPILVVIAGLGIMTIKWMKDDYSLTIDPYDIYGQKLL